MRILDGEQVLVRIFIGESDRWHHRPLTDALLERLRKEGFAGATVFQGIAGFGARSVLHTTHILRLSEDLPVVIEVVDTAILTLIFMADSDSRPRRSRSRRPARAGVRLSRTRGSHTYPGE